MDLEDDRSDEKRSMLITGLIDASADLTVFFFLILTFRCLLQTMRSIPTLVTMYIAYCAVILIIVIYDTGFTSLVLWCSLVPHNMVSILNFPKLWELSTVMTALKLYKHLVLIVLHMFVSINRAYAVLKPLRYKEVFTTWRTTKMILFIFIISTPLFFIYAFKLFGCVYYFDPQYGGWSYADNACHRLHVMLDYLLSGVVLSFAIVVDIFVALYLARDFRKKRDRSRSNKVNFHFVIQTLILGLANGIFTLYLHTRGTWTTQEPWIDNITKLLDITLAFIYVVCITSLNNTIRAEMLHLICCQKNENRPRTIIVVSVRSTQQNP